MAGIVFTQLPTTVTASGGTNPLQINAFGALAVDVAITAVSGTSPNLTIFLERQGADGSWYAIWAPTAITAAGTASTSVGPGCSTAEVLTNTVRLRWEVTGTSPSFTFSVSIWGR